jgi:hypothetical protein
MCYEFSSFDFTSRKKNSSEIRHRGSLFKDFLLESYIYKPNEIFIQKLQAILTKFLNTFREEKIKDS